MDLDANMQVRWKESTTQGLRLENVSKKMLENGNKDEQKDERMARVNVINRITLG